VAGRCRFVELVRCKFKYLENPQEGFAPKVCCSGKCTNIKSVHHRDTDKVMFPIQGGLDRRELGSH